MYSDTILANQENVVISYMSTAAPPHNVRPPNANISSRGPRDRTVTKPRPQRSLLKQLPLSAPRANPSLPRAGVSRSIRKLLDATTPGGVRGICNKHCNPQCLWDETKGDFVNPLPNYDPKDRSLDDGCKQLCRDETCKGLDTTTQHQMFKSIVGSVVGQAAEAIPVVKHLPVARSLGNIAAGAYKWYGEQFTGTHADKVEAANRERRELAPHKSPDFVVDKQPEYSTDRRSVTQQPSRTRGGTRHRRAKMTRHQKKKRQRKSHKRRRTKRRHSGRRGTRRRR